MVLLTMIARIPDGLPLAASMQDDEQVFFFLPLMLENVINNYSNYKVYVVNISINMSVDL